MPFVFEASSEHKQQVEIVIGALTWRLRTDEQWEEAKIGNAKSVALMATARRYKTSLNRYPQMPNLLYKSNYP